MKANERLKTGDLVRVTNFGLVGLVLPPEKHAWRIRVLMPNGQVWLFKKQVLEQL